MKIAIFTDGPDLTARVAHRIGTAQWLLLIDADSGVFEALSNPVIANVKGAGVQAIAQATNLGAQVILTGTFNAAITSQFEVKGVKILSGLRGTAEEALQEYRNHWEKQKMGEVPYNRPVFLSKAVFTQALRGAIQQFSSLLPVLAGVVFLIGLFNVFMTKEVMMSIFSGHPMLDTLWGACFGSVFAGNPINSYIIGGEMLKHGVSLMAVTAFLMTWVTVGLFQLPMESAALGKRFALLRNGLSFVFSMPLALVTVIMMDALERWIS